MVINNLDIAIIDYGINNLFSVKRACDIMGLKSQITSDPDVINTAKAAILPGVGAFPYAMKMIKEKKLDHSILKFINSNKPFLGICLGMHLLLDSSCEFIETKGLGIIKGHTSKFIFFEDNKNICTVPQIGWNKIFSKKLKWKNSILEKNDEQDFMYFVHSFYVETDENIVLSETTYGETTYCSSFQKENIMATQFHPEKSSAQGLKIYEKFKEMICKD